MGELSLYFAYGSNLDESQMSARCPEATAVSVARLDGHRLAFTRWSPPWQGGVADVVADREHCAWGLLWSLPLTDLEALDRYEGHPVNYRRTLKSVVTADHLELEAWVYEVVDKRSFVAPAPAYLATLLRAARVHSLPSAYIDDIRAAAAGTAEQ